MFNNLLARFGRGYLKSIIKEKATPYIAVLRDGGIGEREIRYLINNNLSLYKDFMPTALKKAIIEEFRSDARYLNNIDDNLLAIFVEAITDEVPWFAKVVSADKKHWLLRELSFIKKDLETKDVS